MLRPPRARCLTLLLALAAGCTSKPGRPAEAWFSLPGVPSREVTPLEYRWSESQAWQPVASLRREPPGRGSSNTLRVRFTVGSTACVDPVIYLSSCVYLKRTTVGSRAIVNTDCFVPIRPDEVGQVIELTFESSQNMREGAVLQACQHELRTSVARSESSALWVAYALLVIGAFLGLIAARGGAEARSLASACLFCLSAGVMQLLHNSTAALFVPLPPPLLRAIRDVAAFLMPGALAAFVAFTVPGRTKVLFSVTWLSLGLLVVAVALDVAGALSLRNASLLLAPLSAAAVLAAVIHLLRHRTNPTARTTLMGLSFSLLFATPDLFWSLGVQVVNNNVGHWGMLVLLAALALVLQDRFRDTVRALEQRVTDVGRLNEELRFQVESRSKELRDLLSGRALRVARDFLPGEVIAARYRVEGLLGRGGMAQVYRVTRLSDGEGLALKLLTGQVTSADAARFAREAELASRLRHPNLVPVVDVGLLADGPLYLVMQLVDGQSLEQCRTRFGEVRWAWRVLADVARGLSAVHEAGIIHRDLKPANVLLSGEVAKLSDFGVARAAAALETTPDPQATTPTTPRSTPLDKLTQTGSVIGTPWYMAPEVVAHQPATRASDVFALGLMAFELFTGKYPLVEPPWLAALEGREPERVVDDAEVPAPLRALFAQMLHEQPAQRPRVEEVLAVLTKNTPP